MDFLPGYRDIPEMRYGVSQFIGVGIKPYDNLAGVVAYGSIGGCGSGNGTDFAVNQFGRFVVAFYLYVFGDDIGGKQAAEPD